MGCATRKKKHSIGLTSFARDLRCSNRISEHFPSLVSLQTKKEHSATIFYPITKPSFRKFNCDQGNVNWRNLTEIKCFPNYVQEYHMQMLDFCIFTLTLFCVFWVCLFFRSVTLKQIPYFWSVIRNTMLQSNSGSIKNQHSYMLFYNGFHITILVPSDHSILTPSTIQISNRFTSEPYGYGCCNTQILISLEHPSET